MEPMGSIAYAKALKGCFCTGDRSHIDMGPLWEPCLERLETSLSCFGLLDRSFGGECQRSTRHTIGHEAQSQHLVPQTF